MMYENAYAKINLFLDVLSRRADGYHDLCTYMQTVSLCDTVSAEITENMPDTQIVLTISVSELPADETNLAYRAALRYLAAAEIKNVHLRMHIEKRIPLSAGLAGGSTDAAAVLRLLNRHFGHRLSLDTLCAIGKTLGADVSFCLVGGVCRCDGIGEILTPISAPAEYHVVIAKAHAGVSTPEAFHRLDALYGDFSVRPQRDIDLLHHAIEHGDIPTLSQNIYNAFEEVILPLHPEAALLKEQMLAHGAAAAMMSGSGPSVFGIFSAETDALRCTDAIGKSGVFAAICHPVSK